MRGTSEEARVAEFLFAQMDKPSLAHPSAQKLQSAAASPEFRMDDTRSSLVRVFYIPNTKTVQTFQEVVTLVRSITDLRWAFTYNAARAVGVRGTDDQIALAKWLFENLDAASVPEAHADRSALEYRFSPTSDDLVRVFYLASASAPEHLQETASQVRQKFLIRRVFTYSVPSAVVIRDTAQKIALAGQLIQQQDK
jgi:hypothetical protein